MAAAAGVHLAVMAGGPDGGSSRMVAVICPIAVDEDFDGTGVGHQFLKSIVKMIQQRTRQPLTLIMQPVEAAWTWWMRQGATCEQGAYDLGFAFEEAAAPKLANSLRRGCCCIHAMIIC